MNINLNQLLFDMNREPIMEQIYDYADTKFYNTNGAFPIKISRKQTVKNFVLNIINTSNAKENENILDRSVLFVKIVSQFDSDIKLEAEDIMLIKDCAKKVATPLVYAQLEAILSGKDNPLAPTE